jgi:hypothetical protein
MSAQVRQRHVWEWDRVDLLCPRTLVDASHDTLHIDFCKMNINVAWSLITVDYNPKKKFTIVTESNSIVYCRLQQLLPTSQAIRVQDRIGRSEDHSSSFLSLSLFFLLFCLRRLFF